jgi:SAM-dependent methyltransferase
VLSIDYRVGDLSRALPDLTGRFDRIGSYLALNDVADYVGFAATLAALAKPGGRAVLALNNPYSLPVRGHIRDYFARGARGVYGGMSAALGGEVDYYHRTMGEYLDGFLGAGWRLARLVDLPAAPRDDLSLPPGSRFPLFIVLAFVRPAQGAEATRTLGRSL